MCQTDLLLLRLPSKNFLRAMTSKSVIDRELESAFDIDNLAEMEAASNRVRKIIEQAPMDVG